MDDIVDELGSFTLMVVSGGSMVLTMAVRASRQCPVYPESINGSFYVVLVGV